ncbi:MAG TPA: SDR family oxidoreductase [Archangium sp.]|nr:SDR family oxidoreductase [Archangium sp.]
MKVQNKIVVVTGGGNGMGRELVLALLSKGASVAAVDINASALEETVKLAGMSRGNLATYTVNITDRAAVEALPEQVISRFGAVDGIINNAGVIQPFVKLKDLDYAAIDRVMDVNLFGTLYMIKTFLPHLLARPEAHITNISSMGGFLPVPGQTIYGASKAAVKLLTEGLSSELQGTNVRVTVVFPGAVGTNIAANSGVMDTLQVKAGEAPPVKMLAPDKAARIILEGIENNRYRVLVGSDSKLMDAVYRLNPQRAARFILNQMSGLLPQ